MFSSRAFHLVLVLCASATLAGGCSTDPSRTGTPGSGSGSAPATATADAPEVPAAFGVRHYAVSLEIEPAGESAAITGEAVLRAAVEAGGVLTLDAVAFEDVEIASESEIAWSYDGERIVVRPAGPVARVIRLAIRYRATPSRGVTAGAEGIWTVFHTWHWMPCTVDPGRRATIELSVTGPPGWTVLATGDGPGAPGPDDASTTPYPSYLYGFAMGRFERAEAVEADGVSIEVWAPSTAPAVDGFARRTAAALGRWRSSFGQRWALDRYVQVLVPGRAAQELAGMAFLSAGYAEELARNPQEDWLVVHELAHQAWGNQVTCATWGDFWINEAFVVWWVARDKLLRGDPEGYRRELSLWTERASRALAEGADARIHRPGATVDSAGGTVVYHAGALFVAELAEGIHVATLEATLARLMQEAHERDGLSLSTSELLDALPLEPGVRAWAERRLAGQPEAAP